MESSNAVSKNGPVNSRRYVDPQFISKLQNKNISTFLSNYKSNSSTKMGSKSLSQIISIDETKYIIRVTPYKSYAERMWTDNEIAIYEKLKKDSSYPQYISNLLYADSYKSTAKKESIFLFEYEPGQVLSEFIETNKGKLSKDAIMNIYNHLDEAIDFLAKNKVVHRDIKPENIYVSSSRNIPLLFDFDASCQIGKDCKTYQYTGSPKYATPNSKRLRYQFGFTKNTDSYIYSPIYDKYSLAVMLETDLSKLASTDTEKEEIQSYAKHSQGILLAQNINQQEIKGGYNRMRKTRKMNKTRKSRKTRGGSCGTGTCQMPQMGGAECKIGVLFPRFGGANKQKPENTMETLLNLSESLISGGGCGCGAPKRPMIDLPSNLSLGPLTTGLTKGGACPCQAVAPLPKPLGGGYRATKRNLKYLRKYKRGIPIGFTMRSSLKAKGLIPRSNGTRRVSPKYRSAF
jgi:serine/threonine protein kinase